MTPQKLMKSRVNTAFLIMCLTLACQTVAALPTTLFTVLSTLGITLDGYYTGFIVPQVLYPLCNGVLVVIVLRCIRFPLRSVVTVKAPKADLVPWLGVFLGVVVVMNYLVTWMVDLLGLLGIRVPDIFVSYVPQDIPQAICYFIVLAVLPPICEEILCRCAVTGLLKYFHPWTAVLVSAFAFGMMHATLQQIPFAFVLGLVLGFVYVKTGNLLYPILFHFVNNAWACVLTYLSVWAGEDYMMTVSYGADILFVLFGIGSVIYLILKKQFTLRDVPHSLDAASARRAVVTSPTFWIFTGLYLGTTVMNYLALLLAETVGISL